MSEEQACLVRARSDSENSSNFGSISRAMTYNDGKLTEMLNPSAESGEPAAAPRPPPEPRSDSHDTHDGGDLLHYDDAALLAQFHEDALKQSKCGVAQLRVLLACGLALSGAALELAVIPFVLPSAEIELCILSHEKSWLVLITLVGASLGGVGWGSLAAALGRRRALVSCLAVNAVFSTIAAFMPTYGTFMMARFCSGIGSGGIYPTVFTYVAECSPRAARGKLTPALLVFWALGGLYACAVAKSVLPATGTETLIENKEHFSAWHRYLLLCTLPILASLVSLIWTHESPRYLLEVGREVDAMMVYQSMHSSNQIRACGKSAPAANDYRLGEVELPGKRRPHAPNHMRHNVKMFWLAFFQLFSRTYRHTTISLGGTLLFAVLAQFCLASYTSSYVSHLENQDFGASKLILHDVLFNKQHFNRTIQNVEYVNATFTDCSFTDMFMSHVTFENCTFLRVNFATIKTSYTYFRGCLFVNSSIIDTDIEKTRDMDENCVLNGTTVRGLNSGCRRHADLTFSIGGLLQRQMYVAVAQIVAAPFALLPYKCRKLFSISVACALCSCVVYWARVSWSLLAVCAVSGALTTLLVFTGCAMLVESYPASLRCTGHGLIMSTLWLGASFAQAWSGALWPGSATILLCLLWGVAALLSLPLKDSSLNLC